MKNIPDYDDIDIEYINDTDENNNSNDDIVLIVNCNFD